MGKNERKLVYYSANSRTAGQRYQQFLHLFAEIQQGPCNVTFTSPDIEELKKQVVDLERKLEIAVDALAFYADKDNWTITEDYDGYIIEGLLIYEDIEDPPKLGRTWTNYGVGGKRARQALKEIKE